MNADSSILSYSRSWKGFLTEFLEKMIFFLEKSENGLFVSLLPKNYSTNFDTFLYVDSLDHGK